MANKLIKITAVPFIGGLPLRFGNTMAGSGPHFAGGRGVAS